MAKKDKRRKSGYDKRRAYEQRHVARGLCSQCHRQIAFPYGAACLYHALLRFRSPKLMLQGKGGKLTRLTAEGLRLGYYDANKNRLVV